MGCTRARVQSNRLDYTISFSPQGGMDVEEHWDQVQTIHLDVADSLTSDRVAPLIAAIPVEAKHPIESFIIAVFQAREPARPEQATGREAHALSFWSGGGQSGPVQCLCGGAARLLGHAQVFLDLDCTMLEMNPFTFDKSGARRGVGGHCTPGQWVGGRHGQHPALLALAPLRPNRTWGCFHTRGQHRAAACTRLALHVPALHQGRGLPQPQGVYSRAGRRRSAPRRGPSVVMHATLRAVVGRRGVPAGHPHGAGRHGQVPQRRQVGRRP